MLVLYEHSEKRLLERLRFDAGIHGIKLDEEEERNVSDSTPEPVRSSPGKCIPGDPDSYSHLSMEERQRLTENLMGRHKAWNDQNKPLGGKAPVDKR